MDGLLAELATKRKALAAVDSDERPKKYMRRGELERLRGEKERAEREAKAASERAAKETADAAKAAERTAKVSMIPRILSCYLY